jgi:hypothetical protein
MMAAMCLGFLKGLEAWEGRLSSVCLSMTRAMK